MRASACVGSGKQRRDACCRKRVPSLEQSGCLTVRLQHDRPSVGCASGGSTRNRKGAPGDEAPSRSLRRKLQQPYSNHSTTNLAKTTAVPITARAQVSSSWRLLLLAALMVILVSAAGNCLQLGIGDVEYQITYFVPKYDTHRLQLTAIAALSERCRRASD